MDLWTFWQSVPALRRVEFITLVATMVFPIISGTVLLTLRHRIKTIQSDTSHHQGEFYHDHIGNLKDRNHALAQELSNAQTELAILKRITAPRRVTPLQADIVVEKLHGVKASPVLITAYAFEEESAAYAREIADVLRAAGWDVTVNKTSMNDFKGMSLGKINLMNQPVSGLHELSEAFSAARIEVRPHEIRPDTIAGPMQDGSLLIVVGRR